MICSDCKESKTDLYVVKGSLICRDCKKERVKTIIRAMPIDDQKELFESAIPQSVAWSIQQAEIL